MCYHRNSPAAAGSGCMELDDQSGYNLHFSGTTGVAARGVGLIMQRDVLKSVKCLTQSRIGLCGWIS